MILVDTDIVIDLLRNYPPARVWLETLDNEELLLPGIVLMELIQGCRDKTEQHRIEVFKDQLYIVWPSPSQCDKALAVFASCYLSHSLGILDALIAQTAVGMGLPLYTFNQKHYEVVPELQTIQPYEKPV